MEQENVQIILANPEAARTVASAARISTQQGTALEIYKNSSDREKNLKLIGKVLSSGHKSVLEHQTLSIAFDNVSVLVEQFVIEFRLASFTVKSRRYVDFSTAGYVQPADMPAAVREIYDARTAELFQAYDRLLSLEIPKEDARFVLPYGFRSNFYVTLNARELIWMVRAMLQGRGSRFAELRAIGERLKAQFDALYPGILDAELAHPGTEKAEELGGPILAGCAKEPEIRLVSAPEHPMELLDTAMRFGRRFGGLTQESLKALLRDDRPRELELLNYSFRIDQLSLACVTHFTRHRMLSLQIRHEYSALAEGNFVLPESVAANRAAAELYGAAFEAQAAAAERAQEAGATPELLSYFAMAGHTTSILLSINARELAHFARLRTCVRAQWEIQNIARAMVEIVNETDARPIFQGFGPTCAMRGRCPEGKMSCGHPVTIENGVWHTK